jgi:hypothetical protein
VRSSRATTSFTTALNSGSSVRAPSRLWTSTLSEPFSGK